MSTNLLFSLLKSMRIGHLDFHWVQERIVILCNIKGLYENGLFVNLNNKIVNKKCHQGLTCFKCT